MKMGFVIEDALLHHLQALRRLPQDVLVPARLVVSPESFEEVAERIRKPRRPAPAMRALMKKSSRG